VRERTPAPPCRDERVVSQDVLERPPLARGWPAAIKRGIDIAGSFALLALCSLPMLAIAAIVKVSSPGPALFRQERIGRGGRRFTMLKFRTMRIDAEAATGPVWARRDDPRRTWFGSFLRRLSLDELPQFINILRGEMSLVGPRPERPYFVEKFSREMPAYHRRHALTPGLTGWAQLNGLRGDTSVAMRLEFDLYYVRHGSPWLDLFILLMTPIRVLTDKHAY
jgi:exopolysaccharide biosynthesis polyprenyl glycosylphosphotransferase